MDTLAKLPETVKKGLIDFLSEIPVEKYSEKWRGIQVAIAMITAPGSFKKGVHVYLNSHDSGREEGYYDIQRMSVKIWPHKIQMKRTHEVWSSWNGTEENELRRYIFPDEKYGVHDFKALMDYSGDLFSECYSEDNSDYCGHCSSSAGFSVETNVK